MESLLPENKPESWLDKPIVSLLPKIKVEHGIIALILILAVISRFTNLGARVMAHDEVNHVIPSYDLYQGRGYVHSPVTHGPLQFHLIAATYFMFGDSDFTSRIPHALFGVASIAFVIDRLQALPRSHWIAPGGILLPDLSLHALLQPLCPQ